MTIRIDAASHLKPLFNQKARKKIVRWAKSILKNSPYFKEVNAIAVRGVSGIVFGSLVADACNLQLIVARKPSDKRHSSRDTEGLFEDCKYVILDDLIDSGETFQEIQETLIDSANNRCISIPPVCLGGILYDCLPNSRLLEYGRVPHLYCYNMSYPSHPTKSELHV